MRLIAPEELPIWVPGQLTVDSAECGWDGLRIRGYEYENLDVHIPGMADYMIVVYKRGVTPMNRRCSGPWQSDEVAPGVVSILTQAEQCHWHWTTPIEVLHLYVSPKKLAQVASDALDKEVEHVELRDILRATDPALGSIANALRDEAAPDEALGSPILIESITNQICVHLLRHYAGDFKFRARPRRGLSPAQMKSVTDYIDAHISENISLAELASIANSSVFYFVRQFQSSFSVPPHAYIVHRRLEKARSMVARENVPLKLIAAHCGFSDQSHMTRLFKKIYNVTPGAHRQKQNA